MPKSTRIPGHGLLSEGKPYWWDSQKSSWERAYGTKDGVALCSCGRFSQTLHNDAERKRWMNIHKRQVREQATNQTKEA